MRNSPMELERLNAYHRFSRKREELFSHFFELHAISEPRCKYRLQIAIPIRGSGGRGDGRARRGDGSVRIAARRAADSGGRIGRTRTRCRPPLGDGCAGRGG